MKKLIVIIALVCAANAVAVDNMWYGPYDTSYSTTTLSADTTTRLMPIRMIHNVTIDTMWGCWKYCDSGDRMYGVIYSLDANGQPNSRLGRTADSITGDGKGKCTFASSVNLSENTTYAIGWEVINGDGTSHSVNCHKDTLRYKMFWYIMGEIGSTWDTANDAVATGALMPWVQIGGATTVAYDSTVLDSSFGMTKDNSLEEGLSSYDNNGTSSTVMIGKNNQPISGWQQIGIFSNEDDTETYIYTFFKDTADIVIYDSIKFKYSASNNLTATDTFVIHALKIDSSGTSIPFHETHSDWDTIRGDGANRALWNGNGASGSATDYYTMPLDTFMVGDTNSSGWYVFGGDTATYNNWMKRRDSIIAGKWYERGYKIKCLNCSSKNDNLLLVSGESTNKPVMWYRAYKLDQIASGSWTTNWNSDINWHDADMDWNDD